MDTDDYMKNAEGLLNQPTYKIIPDDPTTRQKNKLINQLKNMKVEGYQYRSMQEDVPHWSRIT